MDFTAAFVFGTRINPCGTAGAIREAAAGVMLSCAVFAGGAVVAIATGAVLEAAAGAVLSLAPADGRSG